MGVLATGSAAFHLDQICAEWRQNFPLMVRGNHASVDFPRGRAQFTAGDMALVIICEVRDDRSIDELCALVSHQLRQNSTGGEPPPAISWGPPTP